MVEKIQKIEVDKYQRKKTQQVKIRDMYIGSNYPVAIQSMTNTNTADVDRTVEQIIQLYEAGSELVRFTVQNLEMARSVSEIKKKLDNIGYNIPLIGDFHYNGHQLLDEVPSCADALDKYRINPGNVGFGEKHDPNFVKFIDLAKEYDKPVRIGVNWGSLDPKVLSVFMDTNSKSEHPKPSQDIIVEAVVESAVQSVNKAIEYGLEPNKILVSTKISLVPEMVYAYELLSERIDQPLHLGLTEAGIGSKGIIASTASLSQLLVKGIGDTIRVSLTPTPNSSRSEEVKVCQQILQSLDMRHFSPQVTSCPGCGRTTSTIFQELAQDLTEYLTQQMPEWKKSNYEGVEEMNVAVMGCIVNGPGESRQANIGISLPGTGEDPYCIIFEDGKQTGSVKASDARKVFKEHLEAYVKSHYGQKKPTEVKN